MEDNKISYIDMVDYLNELSMKCAEETNPEEVERLFFYINTKQNELNIYKKLHFIKIGYVVLFLSFIILYGFDVYCFDTFGYHLAFDSLGNILMTSVFGIISVICSYVIGCFVFAKDFIKKKFKK